MLVALDMSLLNSNNASTFIPITDISCTSSNLNLEKKLITITSKHRIKPEYSKMINSVCIRAFN